VRTFAGQTITVSFYAKGTNPTTENGIFARVLQNFGTGGSPSSGVNITSPKFQLTANWTRYSFTFNVGSISGKTLGTNGNDFLQIEFSQGSSISTDAWTLDIWGVQAEAGSVATGFQTATGTIQGELAACQRYFKLLASGADTHFANGSYASNTLLRAFISFPVQMRITPTVIATSGTDYYQALSAAATDDFNSVNFANGNSNGISIFNNTEMAGTGGQGCIVKTNNASASVAFSAEL
jgi:hypothetical protein